MTVRQRLALTAVGERHKQEVVRRCIPSGSKQTNPHVYTSHTHTHIYIFVCI